MNLYRDIIIFEKGIIGKFRRLILLLGVLDKNVYLLWIEQRIFFFDYFCKSQFHAHSSSFTSHRSYYALR